MSNFNVTTTRPPGSAISLGGEWTRRHQAEANKYKSALYSHVKQRRARYERKREEIRPRSTPGVMLPAADGAASQHTTPPKSAPPGSKPRCDRFYEVDQWAGRRALTPHLKMKKSPRSHSQDECQDAREYLLGSGMTMAKSRNRVAVTIDTGLSMSPPPQPEILQQAHDSGDRNSADSEALIAQLQQQVADLTLYLGEERLNHKSTKEKATALMKERLQELDSRHMERHRQTKEDYEDRMDVMKQIHAKEKEHQKTTLDMQIAKLKGELEFLQGAFDAYKKTLIQDMEEKWSKKEQDLNHKQQEEMESALHQQRLEMLEEKNVEKNEMSREYHKQMEEVDREHKKEIEGMMKKFSTASSDVENLRRALDQLKAVRDELDQTTERLAMTDEILQETKEELQEANLKILNFQDNFQNRVNEVDSKYKAKMDHLLHDNAELRKRYIAKCGELFSEKSNTEYKWVEKIASTKELLQMIVHTKNRSNVNMASGDQRHPGKKPVRLVRPTSAPSTERECKFAFQTAGNAESADRDEAIIELGDASHPRTTTPGRRKLNRESMHERSFRTLKQSSLQPP